MSAPRGYRRYATWLLVLIASMACTATEASTGKKKSSRALRTYIKTKGLERRHRSLKADSFPLIARVETTDSHRQLSKDLLDYLKKDATSTSGHISRGLGQRQNRGRRRKRMFSNEGGKAGGKSGGTSKGKSGGKSGVTSKGSKGQGGKGGTKGSKGGSSKDGLKKICKGLDFGGFYGVNGNISSKGSKVSKIGKIGKGGKSGKSGRGKVRQLTQDRSLQFDGELCEPNTIEVARMNPDLSIFVDLIEHANLQDIFLCAGPFTILAPSNAAFNKNPDLLKSFFNPRNIEAVQELLLYHIVPGLFLTDDLVAGPLQTLLGEEIVVTLDPLMFNQAGVTTTDILACNGVIDIIDDVLIPPDSPILPEICEILDFRQPGEFPLMSRFGAIFHRDLESASLEATGHRQLQYQGERCNANVFDTASKNPDLSTFVDLIKAAGLEDLFLCAGPFTVLAPTNEAFAGLDPVLLADLLRPENQELLQEVLLYHILPGFQPSSQLEAGTAETLLFGFGVDVTLSPIMFNNANVLVPDIMACNGVLYVIDDVLVPDAPDICDAFTFSNRRRLQDGGENCEPNVLEIARENPELSTVVSLIEAADLQDIFSCAGPFTALFPSNAAFDELDPAFVDFLLDPVNQDDLQDLLLYHILPGATLSSQFTAGPTETLFVGETVDVTVSPLGFNDAGVVTPDVTACNGYIDIIDEVLNPFPQPTGTPTIAPGFTPTVAPTVAPTLLDICANFTFTRRFRKLQNGGLDCKTNVLDTARENMDLSVITMLIDLAGLTEVFNCPGPFTALFPSNTAFDDIDMEMFDSLVDPNNIDELRIFLLYHILPGATLSTEFTVGPTPTLLPDFQVDVSSLVPLQFDESGVFDTDIEACNGYIDILDTVLNPFDTPSAPTTTPTGAPTAAPITPGSPTAAPVVATDSPTGMPTVGATEAPTVAPSARVSSEAPTAAVSSEAPTAGGTSAPSGAPIPLAPTSTPVQVIRVEDYYLAFVAPDATREPTQDEYNEMLTRTTDYFIMYFMTYFAGNPDVTLLDIMSETDYNLYNAGVPEARFNIYMNFNISAYVYTEESTPPTPGETLDLMVASITTDFILTVVRTFTGSPFESTNEVKIAASSNIVPPSPSP